jgi:hypothetical protein
MTCSGKSPLSLKRMAGFEERTRHKSEDRLISSGFQPRLKQNALFPRARSDSKTDSNGTGISCADTPQHFFGS